MWRSTGSSSRIAPHCVSMQEAMSWSPQRSIHSVCVDSMPNACRYQSQLHLSGRWIPASVLRHVRDTMLRRSHADRLSPSAASAALASVRRTSGGKSIIACYERTLRTTRDEKRRRCWPLPEKNIWAPLGRGAEVDGRT